ncbi:MAG: hypothetical protein K6T33_05890 [Thermomonas hydrothermalis]|uniref:hypothetical protein n=1 Tax=Thermomonas hydrothermalis TaxID=213588 RepID=UPI002353F520|nr:hypothetical protein [Thermomonas hydrothermalis]MCL6619304.1 hypothetical protein [Thermomonas hydrothermalis]
MKPLLALVLSVAISASAAQGCEADLLLSKPSVVVLYTPDRELSQAERNEPGFTDFIDDFQTYQMALAAALKGNRQVQYLVTSAPCVRLKGVQQPVSRKALGGFGIVVFVPGKPPAVFEGVATDADVLCELHRRLPKAVVAHGCGA